MRSLVGSGLLVAATLAGTPAFSQVLFWADTQYGSPVLRRANPNGTQLSSLPLPAGTLPEGIALDLGRNRLFYVESAWSGARVRTANVSLTSTTDVASGLSCLRGVAVDAVHGKIYWTSTNLDFANLVQRSNLDGSNVELLNALLWPANLRGIAVDPAGGKYYVADFGRDWILRANLDGSGLEIAVTTPTNSSPFGLALDVANQRLYWTEYAGKIRRSQLDGTGMTTLVSSIQRPTYLALDLAGGNMYWTEAGATPRVATAPLAGGASSTLPLTLGTYGGIAFAQSAPVSVEAPEIDRIESVELAPLHPNPSAGETVVEFALPSQASVRLRVVDLQGRTVRVLADRSFDPGRHRLTWDARGVGMAPGIYFVVLQSQGREWTRRVAITR